MAEERKQPELRFKGFTDDWIQCELGDISKKVNEKNKKFEVKETFTNSAELGIISQKDYFDRGISNDKNIDKYYVVYPDDFVYNPRISNYAPYGPIRKNNLNRIGVMSPLYNIFRINSSNINLTFLEYYFISGKWHKFMYQNGDSGARSDRFSISTSDFRQMPIFIPSTEEQKFIGYILKTISKIITLEQKKIEKLELLKQYLLQNMFADENGYPKIRFNWVSNLWDEKTLNQIGKITGGGTPSTTNSEFWNGEINWFTPTEVGKTKYVNESSKKITELGLKKSSASLLPANRTVLFTSRAGIGDVSILGKEAATNQGFQSIVVGEDFDPNFVYYQSDKIKKYALSHANGSTFLEISNKEMKKANILVPSLKEQKAIGELLSHLDNVMFLEDNNIELLKSLKSKLLQSLFI